MITTSGRRRSPVFTIAFLVSLLLHLIGLLVYAGLAARLVAVTKPAPRPTDDLAALSDVVRIEKRVVPRQAVVRPPPAPVVVARRPALTPVPAVPPAAAPTIPATAVPTVASTVQPTVHPTHAPSASPRELAHIERIAAPEPRAAPPATPAPATLAAATPASATVPPATTAASTQALTPGQIAALTSRFARTIAQAQSDVVNHPAPQDPAAAARRDALVMTGEQHVLQHAQGYYVVLEAGRSGDTDWYYLAVRMQWPDGYAESVDVPWPVQYPRDDDPVARRDRLSDVPPPPGYVLPQPFQLSRIVCTYFRPQCQAVLDAEHRGGRAAAN